MRIYSYPFYSQIDRFLLVYLIVMNGTLRKIIKINVALLLLNFDLVESKTVSEEGIKEDLAFVKQKMDEIHPSPYAFVDSFASL